MGVNIPMDLSGRRQVSRPMRIVDCFLFFNELELLELRLNELSDVVDEHVLVEATHTFRGERKELVYTKNRRRFKKYENKITHLVVDNPPEYELPLLDADVWVREHNQRKALRQQFDWQEGDWVLLSDVDEIPRPRVIKNVIKGGNPDAIYVFRQELYYYWVNLRQNQIWCGTLMFQPKDHCFQELRDARWNRPPMTFLENGGWHFSYLGDVARIQKKMRASSETTNEKFLGTAWLEECCVKGLDHLQRDGEQFRKIFVKVGSSFPRYITKWLVKYPSLCKRLHD